MECHEPETTPAVRLIQEPSSMVHHPRRRQLEMKWLPHGCIAGTLAYYREEGSCRTSRPSVPRPRSRGILGKVSFPQSQQWPMRGALGVQP
jgi:hypothetical protein